MESDKTNSALAGGMELAPGVWCPANSIRWQFVRSSGPGGQNVNKVNTKAEMWLQVAVIHGLDEHAASRLAKLAGKRLTSDGAIHIVCDSHRSREANRAEVLARLSDLLIEAMRKPRRRRKTRPTAASRQRRLNSKKHRSQLKTARHASDY